MTILKKPLFKDLLSFFAGGLLFLAFAPFNLYPLAFIAPLILYWLWQNETNLTCFKRGYFFGLGLLGLGTSWVFISIYNFGNTNLLWSTLITSSFVMFYALYFAVNGYLLNKFFPKHSLSKLFIVYPAMWALLEVIRSYVITGFPWLFLGTSQTDSLLLGYAKIIGTYGLSYLCIAVGGLVLLIFTQKSKTKIVSIIGLTAIFLSGYLLSQHEFTKPLDKHLKVSLLQANIAQEEKWLQQSTQKMFRKYEEMTEKSIKSDLIIYPEGAITIPLPKSKPFYDYIDTIAKANGATVLLSMSDLVKHRDTYRNSEFANILIAAGVNHGKYVKRNLVPFGEYLPLENYLRGLIGFFDLPMSSYVAGPKNQELLNISGVKLASLICYEISYPELTRQSAKNANALVTISDDSWFGNSVAPYQHLQIARMRAIEMEKPLLRANNTGITAIVNHDGTIKEKLPMYHEGILTNTVTPREGMTPYAFMGEKMIIAVMTLLLLIAFYLRKLNKNK